MKTVSERPLSPFGFITRHGIPLALLPAWSILLLSMVCGCGFDRNHDLNDKVLIRAGESVVTVRAFHEAFESSITSPSQLFQDPNALREEKYRILNRLSEELLILERARELNLEISDEETARVVNELKKDYPDDTFEKTLVENGISYLTWEKALKRRLLMEKVIRQDLSDNVFKAPFALDGDLETDNEENSSEAETANNDGSEDETAPEDEDLPDTPDKTAGVEDEYLEWINHLKKQYAIEINWKLWEIVEQEETDGV